MKKRALIPWGGWAGHRPEEGANIVAGMLSDDGFDVTLTPDYAAFADAAEYDLVVPVITNDQIDTALVDSLTRAVRAGTGLAGYHGGLAASFHSAVRFHYLCGLHWVGHPGDMAARYRVILATTTFSGEYDPASRGVTMPVVIKRHFGAGRIFYTALGHVPEELSHPQARLILRRGLTWAARDTGQDP